MSGKENEVTVRADLNNVSTAFEHITVLFSFSVMTNQIKASSMTKTDRFSANINKEDDMKGVSGSIHILLEGFLLL